MTIESSNPNQDSSHPKSCVVCPLDFFDVAQHDHAGVCCQTSGDRFVKSKKARSRTPQAAARPKYCGGGLACSSCRQNYSKSLKSQLLQIPTTIYSNYREPYCANLSCLSSESENPISLPRKEATHLEILESVVELDGTANPFHQAPPPPPSSAPKCGDRT